MGPDHLRRGPPAQRRQLRLRQGGKDAELQARRGNQAPDYSEAFLLLTATPHQGEENHSRFKNLVRLLDDDVDFSGLEEDFPLLPGGGGSGKKFTEL